MYERLLRVVTYTVIGTILLMVTLTGSPSGPTIYILLALAGLTIVVDQDIVPASAIGRWRRPIQVAAAIAFLALLTLTTGGARSPFFFGYVLLVGAGAVWSSRVHAAIVVVSAGAAYLFSAVLGQGAQPFTPADVSTLVYHEVALALVGYVAWVIGREQRRAREEALRLSQFDAVTGLHSRRWVVSQLEHELLRAARTGRQFALLMIDIDGLKAVNDRFGHAAGDELLRAFAENVQGEIRATDFAGRYGGDEFVVILPDTDTSGATLVAEKVRGAVAALSVPHDAVLITASASIGVVIYPDDGRSALDLMRRADLAMYQAKRRGRNQIVRFTRPSGAAATHGAAAIASSARAIPVGPSVPPESPGPVPWETSGGAMPERPSDPARVRPEGDLMNARGPDLQFDGPYSGHQSGAAEQPVAQHDPEEAANRADLGR